MNDKICYMVVCHAENEPIEKENESIENVDVAFVKGASKRDDFFEKT